MIIIHGVTLCSFGVRAKSFSHERKMFWTGLLEMQRARKGSLDDDLPARMLRRCTLALIYVLAILCRLHKVPLAI